MRGRTIWLTGLLVKMARGLPFLIFQRAVASGPRWIPHQAVAVHEVYEINDPVELATCRMLWDCLLPQTPRASFFHTWDWLNSYWQHFGNGQKLRILVIHAGGNPVGIVPLCVRQDRYRLGTVRTLTYPLDDWGSWYSPIGPNQAASMLVAMQHIQATPRDWDMIDLRWTGPESHDGGRPGRAMRIAGYKPHKHAYQVNSVLEMTGRWNRFLQQQPNKLRRDYCSLLQRLNQRDDLQFIRHRPAPARSGDGDPRWDLYAMCEAVAASSRRADVRDENTLSTGRVCSFLRDAHADAARLGMVDMNLLLASGTPVAFLYSYHFAGRVFALRTGFEPATGGNPPGISLILRAIQDGFRRHDSVLDLGVGEWDYKRQLRTGVATSYRMSYTPMTVLRSQAVCWSRWVKHRFTRQETAREDSVSA